DNGIGMDEETKNNMFTLFFSSKGYRGTGLGLFIANRVLEQHGGSIQVESTMGKGSNFKIALPRELPDRIKNDQSQGNNIIKSEKKDLLPNKTKKK
ncbi:MAG: HAMP domain-containing histidine kinase, partial [Deltaproteobacteria bacterium]|nr:HAMP domain-containing histidine kinase [Deltaproteobacteria bacterium]